MVQFNNKKDENIVIYNKYYSGGSRYNFVIVKLKDITNEQFIQQFYQLDKSGCVVYTNDDSKNRICWYSESKKFAICFAKKKACEYFYLQYSKMDMVKGSIEILEFVRELTSLYGQYIDKIVEIKNHKISKVSMSSNSELIRQFNKGIQIYP